MDHSELGKYILHYIREDRTRSAIMLTADWGTGKSYYIQNELILFLGREEKGCCSCIVVSLYGFKSVVEEIDVQCGVAGNVPDDGREGFDVHWLTAWSKPNSAHFQHHFFWSKIRPER